MIRLLFVLREAAFVLAGGVFRNKCLGLDKWLAWRLKPFVALAADMGLGHSVHITAIYNSGYSISDAHIWPLRTVHTRGVCNVHRNTQMLIK